MDRTEKKALFILVIGFIVFLILIHGNEIGDFRNSDNLDARLYPGLYVLCSICSIPVFVFIKIGELFKTLNLKEKILTIVMIIVLNLLLMFLLSGIALYVDYYTTNKHWKVEKVEFTSKETYGGGKGGETYRYFVKINDAILMFDADVDIPVPQVLNLKICKTDLGMIIANRDYDSTQ